MNKTPPGIKIYDISDKTVDLQRTIENKRAVYSTNLHRTQSQNEISTKYIKDNILQKVQAFQRSRSDRSDDTFEKIPRALFPSIPINNQQRLKKPKLRPRSKTVDSRFKRSRSPTTQHLSTSQITKPTDNSLMLNSNEKPTSNSAPNVMPSDAIEQCGAEPVLENGCINEVINNEQLDSEILRTSKTEQNNQLKLDIQDLKNLTESIHKDPSVHNEESRVFYTEPIRNGEISPYWYDDKVIEKYKNILKPVKNHNFSSLLHPPRISGAKSVPAYNGVKFSSFQRYKYDDITEVRDTYSHHHSKQPPISLKPELDEVSHIPYMMLGCVMGIVIAMSVSWITSRYLDLSLPEIIKLKEYFQDPKDYLKSSIVPYPIHFVGSSIYNVIEKTVSFIVWAVTATRTDFFPKPAPEESIKWYNWWKIYF